MSEPFVLGIFADKGDAARALRRAVSLQGKTRSAEEDAELADLAGKLDHLSATRWLGLVTEALQSPLGLRA